MKKHSISWWIFIGWWWYLLFAWWIYPLKWWLRKSKDETSITDDSYRLVRETKETVLDILKKSDSGTALQVDVKRNLPGRLAAYFDEAVHGLYEDGKIKTSKDGSRVRLELVNKVDAK